MLISCSRTIPASFISFAIIICANQHQGTCHMHSTSQRWSTHPTASLKLFYDFCVIKYKNTFVNFRDNFRFLNNNGDICQTNGFFIECGALDGEFLSNTLYMERSLNWTGILIEADQKAFSQLAGRNRKAYSLPVCLSTKPYPVEVYNSSIFHLTVSSYLSVNLIINFIGRF